MKKLYQSLLLSLFLLLPLSQYATIHEVLSYYDGGTLSFRDAVSIASPCDTILFPAGMSGGTIRFNSEVGIPVSLTILGPAGGYINFVALAPSIRLLNYTGGAFPSGIGPSPVCCNVIKRIRFYNGSPSGNGGAIYTPGPIKIDSCHFINNQAINGGAIAYYETSLGLGLCSMQINDCVFGGNQASQNGGAINVDGGRLSVSESGITNNNAQEQGGGIWYRNTFLSTSRLITNQVSLLANTANQGGAIYHESSAFSAGPASLNALAMAYNEAQEDGGGIYNEAGKIIIKNSPDIHTNKSLHRSGGAIYSKADLTVENSRLYKNEASQHGGGIYLGGLLPTLRLTQTELNENEASLNGGALFLNSDQAVAFINQSEFWANQARNHGGAIYHSAQRLNVDSSRFESNESHVHGGAIYWDGFAQATLDIKQTTLLINRALQGKGGAINMERAGLLELAESTFDRNQAAMEGGGIAAYGDGGTIYWGGFSANLENNTFSQNQSLGNTGGAIDIKGGALWDILHNTFSLNSANDGGAISYGVNLTKLQQINLDHSLIAGNTASGAGVDVFFAGGAGTILSLGSNLIGIIDASGITPSASDLSGTLSSPLAALLGPLANNGGLTWTHLPLAGSPAIDGGTATPLLFDQRGVPRSGAFDIGAVERVSGAPRISVSVSSGVKLWPNPSQGSFQIRLAETYEQPVQIKIFNNAGQLIHTTSLAAGQNELKLNVLRDQPSGIYLVEISGPLERESLRIVRD